MHRPCPDRIISFCQDLIYLNRASEGNDVNGLVSAIDELERVNFIKIGFRPTIRGGRGCMQLSKGEQENTGVLRWASTHL